MMAGILHDGKLVDQPTPEYDGPRRGSRARWRESIRNGGGVV
jgi:hypothetical protein